jgi:hypothetical protein
LNDNTYTEHTSDKLELNLYTEISSGKTFEGKLFETFVIVRPVLPHLWSQTKKLNLAEFGKEFEDFQGDREQVRQFLSKNPDFSWKDITLQ